MREVTGSVWSHHDDGAFVVVPVNLTLKKGGVAVMGAGLALQAAVRFPALPPALGRWIDSGHPGDLFTLLPERVICLPTKYHWRDDSDATLIHQGLRRLRTDYGTAAVAIPLLGAGLGRLDPAAARAMILATGRDCPHWVLVTNPEAHP